MMNFVLKTRNFVLKTRNCVLKTRNYALKMLSFAGNACAAMEADQDSALQILSDADPSAV